MDCRYAYSQRWFSVSFIKSGLLTNTNTSETNMGQTLSSICFFMHNEQKSKLRSTEWSLGPVKSGLHKFDGIQLMLCNFSDINLPLFPQVSMVVSSSVIKDCNSWTHPLSTFSLLMLSFSCCSFSSMSLLSVFRVMVLIWSCCRFLKQQNPMNMYAIDQLQPIVQMTYYD